MRRDAGDGWRGSKNWGGVGFRGRRVFSGGPLHYLHREWLIPDKRSGLRNPLSRVSRCVSMRVLIRLRLTCIWAIRADSRQVSQSLSLCGVGRWGLGLWSGMGLLDISHCYSVPGEHCSEKLSTSRWRLSFDLLVLCILVLGRFRLWRRGRVWHIPSLSKW